MNNINIFVSSTCYDLSQIRVDISDFIKNSGHNPILSEFENFPISPELNTIENCIKIVKENADILVLIVGSRYGSIIDNGKSITNNEFLVAKQKGIPIFCFIDKSTLHALNFWKINKDGNFSNIVDNTKIFEFIEDIRSNSKIWTFPFEKAQDIISTLKTQLSYLFKESLKSRKIFNEEIPDFFKINLSEKALRILLEKKDIYEYTFLAQILVDEIQKKEFLKNDIEYSIFIEPKHLIYDFKDFNSWFQGRITSLKNLILSLESIINNALPIFLNEPGLPADLKGLYYISIKYADLYEHLLNWIIVTKSTYIEEEEFKQIKVNLSELALKSANDMWNFPFKIHSQINNALDRILLGEKNIEINLSMKFELDRKALVALHNNFDQLRKYYESFK